MLQRKFRLMRLCAPSNNRSQRKKNEKTHTPNCAFPRFWLSFNVIFCGFMASTGFRFNYALYWMVRKQEHFQQQKPTFRQTYAAPAAAGNKWNWAIEWVRRWTTDKILNNSTKVVVMQSLSEIRIVQPKLWQKMAKHKTWKKQKKNFEKQKVERTKVCNDSSKP